MELGHPIPRKERVEDWARPGQRARWEAQRREDALAKAPKTSGKDLEGTVQALGVTPEDLVTAGRDKVVLEGLFDKVGTVWNSSTQELPTPSIPVDGPPRVLGYSPWFRWVPGGIVPQGEGIVQTARWLKENIVNPHGRGKFSRWDWSNHDSEDNILFFCYKEGA